MLTALTANGPARRPGGLWERVHTTLHALCEGRGLEFWGPLDAASRYWEADDDQLSISLTDLQRLAGLVKLLAEFGMASGGVSRPVVTPLGRWALERLREGLAGPAGPSLTASELIAEAVPVRGDAEQLDLVVSDWLSQRDPVEAARGLVAAASQLRVLGRSVAVGLVRLLGKKAQPAWQEVVRSPLLGPHARQALADLDAGPQPDDDDRQWLGVEAAAAALEEKGPDEALTELSESMQDLGLEEMFTKALGTGHLDAPDVVRAVTEFVASGAPRSVGLAGGTRSRWRRRSRGNRDRRTRCAWRSRETRQLSTGTRKTRKTLSRLTWRASTGTSPGSAGAGVERAAGVNADPRRFAE
jgi:hypothetical protein